MPSAPYLRKAGLIALRRAEAFVSRRRRSVERLEAWAAAHRDELATRLGGELSRAGRILLLAPHAREEVPLPPVWSVGGKAFDVVDDAAAYTRLPRTTVEDLIMRKPESFRSEWHTLPADTRADHWYYLASRTYLFANAVHLHEDDSTWEWVDAVVPRAAHVLEFGGGTGNLSLALAASGRRVTYLEVSALQKDFVRFRANRYSLEPQIDILDWWQRLEPGSFDAVVALDVFEHLDNLAQRLRSDVLPALKPTGILIEASPFVRNLSNPMHHTDDAALDTTLSGAGFTVVAQDELLRAWRRRDESDEVAAVDRHLDRAERT
jgi:2-polyprenyl-3-methyl-5-hydroxy-6-metoxy-1,4-benzoquinol methylase